MYWASVPMSGHGKGPLSGLVVHGTMLCLLRASLPHIHDASKIEANLLVLIVEGKNPFTCRMRCHSLTMLGCWMVSCRPNGLIVEVGVPLSGLCCSWLAGIMRDALEAEAS